jgi:hypothetical protein
MLTFLNLSSTRGSRPLAVSSDPADSLKRAVTRQFRDIYCQCVYLEAGGLQGKRPVFPPLRATI